MGLFSKKPADSKARIEELKKKIQAEQAAYAAAVAAPAQPAPAPQPVPVQAPPQPAPVAAPAPQPVYQQPAQPVYQQPAQPTYAQAYEEPRAQPRREPVEEIFEEDSMDEIKTGIILDLGEGMSLNLPIRSKMRLEEFLHIADKVRELQRIQR